MQIQSPQLVFEAADVAAFCGADVATIYTWVKKGEISHFKTPGGRLRFKREALIDFLRRFQFPLPPELAEGRARVIAFDADSSWLTRVKSALGRAFEVVAYVDAYDALLAIGSQKPDAVVMEAITAALDGVRCIRRIRAREDLQHTRVVVFADDASEKKACIDAGASAFVLKPEIDELQGTLRRALGQR